MSAETAHIVSSLEAIRHLPADQPKLADAGPRLIAAANWYRGNSAPLHWRQGGGCQTMEPRGDALNHPPANWSAAWFWRASMRGLELNS